MIPVEVKKTNQLVFDGDGRSVNTKIAISGTDTHFTMMMSFTKPVDRLDENQYIASTGISTDQVALWHPANEADNIFSVRIGKTIFTPITVDPNRDINAMVCVYNKDTKEVIGSINGLPYQSFGTVEFDGLTNDVVFGCYDTRSKIKLYPYTGYIGEGIFAASLEPEQTWFDFWDRVKNGHPCKAIEPELLRNSLFDCGLLGWKKNNYDVTLSDNEDGTVHVKAIENYGSISPELLPDTNDGNEYKISCDVLNIVGSGKMSIRINGTWYNTVFSGDGHYERTFTGRLDSIDCGANNDTTAEMDFDTISLQRNTP